MSKTSTLVYLLDTYFNEGRPKPFDSLESADFNEHEITELLNQLQNCEVDVPDNVVQDLLEFAREYQEREKRL